VARVASIQAGLPMDSVAMSVNRLCSSGLQGIVTTAQNILLGDCDYGVGGGVEVMSRGGYLSPAMRSRVRRFEGNQLVSPVTCPPGPFPASQKAARRSGKGHEDQPWRSSQTAGAKRLHRVDRRRSKLIQ
jgi:acetyl-CoA C-acetyltransferase